MEAPIDGCAALPRDRSRGDAARARFINRELELAGVRRAGAGARRGPRPAAAGAGQVRRDLHPEPRRVLPGARLRARGAGGGRRGRRHARRHDAARAARGDPRTGRTSCRRAPRRSCSATCCPRSEKERIRLAHWDQLSARTTGRSWADGSANGSSRCSRRCRSTRRIRSPTSRACRLNVAAAVRDPMTGVRKFARVKVPPLLPRFIELPDGERFVPLEEVIAAHLDQLFPGMDLLSHHFFRVTRDADVEVEEDEADDLLAAIETVLQRRQRGATPIRLEIDDTMSDEMRQVADARARASTNRRSTWGRGCSRSATCGSSSSLDRPDSEGRALDTRHAARAAVGTRALPTSSRRSGAATSSCTTPTTRSRPRSRRSWSRPPGTPTSWRSSRRSTARRPTARSSARWCGRRDAGKQVVALVELKARFDEQANITFARTLETAGRARRVRHGRA